MEFSEKLQQLRKEKSWTQEQLAEKVLVSRTAISKWENGKGYPNIDSLKILSKLFEVSIDDLLSGEELLSLAEDENRTNINNMLSIIYGTLDILMLAFLFLPLYIREDSDLVRTVSLFSNPDISPITWFIYLLLPILLVVIGVTELLTQYLVGDTWSHRCRIISFLFHAFCILIFVATRQPTATALLFLFFMVKIVLLLKVAPNK